MYLFCLLALVCVWIILLFFDFISWWAYKWEMCRENMRTGGRRGQSEERNIFSIKYTTRRAELFGGERMSGEMNGKIIGLSGSSRFIREMLMDKRTRERFTDSSVCFWFCLVRPSSGSARLAASQRSSHSPGEEAERRQKCIRDYLINEDEMKRHWTCNNKQSCGNLVLRWTSPPHVDGFIYISK